MERGRRRWWLWRVACVKLKEYCKYGTVNRRGLSGGPCLVAVLVVVLDLVAVLVVVLVVVLVAVLVVVLGDGRSLVVRNIALRSSMQDERALEN